MLKVLQLGSPVSCLNAMDPNPLVQFSKCTGVLVQGDNKRGRQNALYSELFKRRSPIGVSKWQEPELPFLFVQLAVTSSKKEQATNSDLGAFLREAQGLRSDVCQTAWAAHRR